MAVRLQLLTEQSKALQLSNSQAHAKWLKLERQRVLGAVAFALSFVLLTLLLLGAAALVPLPPLSSPNILAIAHR